MGLANEHVGPSILAKIKIYVLTRAELLITLCYEIPCITQKDASRGTYIVHLFLQYVRERNLNHFNFQKIANALPSSSLGLSLTIHPHEN